MYKQDNDQTLPYQLMVTLTTLFIWKIKKIQRIRKIMSRILENYKSLLEQRLKWCFIKIKKNI